MNRRTKPPLLTCGIAKLNENNIKKRRSDQV
jgi:hypothetical protein